MKRLGSELVGTVMVLCLLAACASPSPTPTPRPTEPPTATQAPAPTSAATAIAPTEPTTTPPADPTASPPPPLHRIGVRYVDGFGEFYDRETGDRFTPRGNNLVRLDTYHNLFNPGHYDSADTDAQLGAMADRGYNVVRVFLDHRPGGLVDFAGANVLSVDYLDNIVDFLGKAKAHGIYVIFCQDWLPDSGERYAVAALPQIAGINALYLTPSGVEANRRFFGDFVSGLIERAAPMDAIWSYELRNELFFEATQPPFNLNSGVVITANGTGYDMSDEANKRRLLEDGLVHFADEVRSEILSRDPSALVSVGFFVPLGPNPTRVGDTRIIETREVIEKSALDFVDLHGYPGADLPLAQHLENFGVTGPTAKPIVMGEMGAFHSWWPDVQDGLRALITWQADTCEYGLDGWLLWSWDDNGSGTGVWGGTEAGGVLADGLAPLNRPDPCSQQGGVPRNVALGQRVRTSHALADAPGASAVDGQPGTIWNSGDYPTQWIEVELAEAVSKGTVRLFVGQDPAGQTKHRLYGRRSADGPLLLLKTFTGDTSDGQELAFSFELDQPIRFLRVETIASPSWVAWKEIVVNPG